MINKGEIDQWLCQLICSLVVRAIICIAIKFWYESSKGSEIHVGLWVESRPENEGREEREEEELAHAVRL